MPKKLLVLNGSHSDIPIIQSGKKLGYYVITTGNQPNLIGHRYADEYHHADFSEKEAILALAAKLGIDAICSCANDFGAITAAYVAERLGLPGHDPYLTCLQLHHKDKFKRIASELHLTSPKARSFSSIDDALAYRDEVTLPVMVKPVDMTGGKGITKVSSLEGYVAAVNRAFDGSKAARIVVEAYIDGSLHSLTTFLRNRHVHFYFCDNEYSYLNPYLVSSSVAPATDFEKVRHPIISEIERIADQLSLVDGVFHTQYILKEGRAWILEVTRRCSGDFYPTPVSASCNIDWADWIVRAECGMDCSNFPVARQQGYFGRHCIMASANGIVDDVIIHESIRGNIFDAFMMWSRGDPIDHYQTHKLGVLFLKFASLAEANTKMPIIHDLVRVTLQSQTP